MTACIDNTSKWDCYGRAMLVLPLPRNTAKWAGKKVGVMWAASLSDTAVAGGWKYPACWKQGRG